VPLKNDQMAGVIRIHELIKVKWVFKITLTKTFFLLLVSFRTWYNGFKSVISTTSSAPLKLNLSNQLIPDYSSGSYFFITSSAFDSSTTEDCSSPFSRLMTFSVDSVLLRDSCFSPTSCFFKKSFKV